MNVRRKFKELLRFGKKGGFKKNEKKKISLEFLSIFLR